MNTDTLQLMINDRYQIDELLGNGSMGQVYRVTDRQTNQKLALKRVLVVDALREAESHEGSALDHHELECEFHLLASLRHPHIVRVIDYDFDQNGQPFFTMDYLVDALTIIAYGQDRPLEGKIRLLEQMFAALAYLHENDILHRDLKPDNVLVVGSQVKLLDFGLSTCLTNAGYALQGTAAYMAPELLRGEPPSKAADLYACGVITYELLVGHHPFDVRNLNQMMLSILYEEPNVDALPVSSAVRALVGRLLAREMRDRPSAAGEVVAELERIKPGLEAAS